MLTGLWYKWIGKAAGPDLKSFIQQFPTDSEGTNCSPHLTGFLSYGFPDKILISSQYNSRCCSQQQK